MDYNFASHHRIIKNPQAQSIADQTDATSVVPISALPPILTAEERRLSGRVKINDKVASSTTITYFPTLSPDYMVYANEGYEPSPTTGNDQFSFGPAVVAGAAAGAAAASVQRTPSNQSNQHRSLYRNPSGSQYRYK